MAEAIAEVGELLNPPRPSADLSARSGGGSDFPRRIKSMPAPGRTWRPATGRSRCFRGASCDASVRVGEGSRAARSGALIDVRSETIWGLGGAEIETGTRLGTITNVSSRKSQYSLNE